MYSLFRLAIPLFCVGHVGTAVRWKYFNFSVERRLSFFCFEGECIDLYTIGLR